MGGPPITSKEKQAQGLFNQFFADLTGSSVNQFEQLFAELPGGILILDEYDIVRACNRSAGIMLGEPLHGMHWEGVTARLTLINQCNDVSLVQCDGRLINMVMSASKGGREKIVLLSDTVSAQAGLAAERHVFDLSENAQRLAHQIRTPLALSLFYTSNLRHHDLSERERFCFLEKVVSALKNVEKTVDEILAFSQHIVIDQEIEVASLLRDFGKSIAFALQAGGCVLTISDQAPQAMLCGNRESLLEALHQLAINAIDACGRGGSLQLSAQAVGPEAIDLILKDNGPGIPADIQSRIREPFFSTKAQSTGLGLTRVQTIAHAHGGLLRCKSQPGNGSIFAMHLPARISAGAQIISLAEKRRNKTLRS